MTMPDSERIARLATAAVDLVEDGMTLGLGTGSTADAMLHALGKRVTEGLRIRGVPTSTRTADLCASLGIEVVALDDAYGIDLGLDGADEIAPNLDVIKGRGGALLHEKLVALSCRTFVIVSASEKLVPHLGQRLPLPIEVVPFGWAQTASRIRDLGLNPTLRISPSGEPYRTDSNNYILDCANHLIADPPSLAADIKATTGVVDHGLFIGIAHAAITVSPDGHITRHRPA